jgi:hypothetical protein
MGTKSLSLGHAVVRPGCNRLVSRLSVAVVTTVQGGDFRPLSDQKFALASPPSKLIHLA